MDEELKFFEALEWLTNNNNPSALASDRFGETANAINFVKNLYDIGVVEVDVIGIWDEPERIEAEGGPCASTLIVKLPDEVEKREQVLEIYKNEIEKYGLNEGEELQGWDEDIIAFWWD